MIRRGEILARLRLIERQSVALRVDFRTRQALLERAIALLLDDMEPGPENSREEVSPMDRSPQRDCSRARLTAAREPCLA